MEDYCQSCGKGIRFLNQYLICITEPFPAMHSRDWHVCEECYKKVADILYPRRNHVAYECIGEN